MKTLKSLVVALFFVSRFASGQQASPPGTPADATKFQRAVAKASASYKCNNDTFEALNDGREPQSSRDNSLPHLSFHPHVGTFEWIQYDFPAPQHLEGCAVYWNSDQHIAKKSPTDKGIGLPEFWKVTYQNEAGDWLPVDGSTPVPSLDAWNVCRFKPVQTKALRLAVQQTSESSAGIIEWKVIPATGAAPIVPQPPNELRLDDLIPFVAKVGFRTYRVNKYSKTEEQLGARVLIDGQPCEHFLFAHASSSISFAVPSGFTRFSAVGIGPTKSGRTNYSWSYQVMADGRQIFQSERLDTYPNHQLKIAADLPPGVKTITLITDAAGSGTDDHSIWANPKLLTPPFSPETKTKLDQLEKQFKTACATQVEAAYAQAMQTLDSKYAAAIQQAYDAAYRAGDNVAVTALLEETRRVKAKVSIPDTDPTELPAGLAALRTAYRSSANAPAATKASKLQPLYNNYDASLGSLAKFLADKPEEAAAVNAIRTRIAATRPAAPVIATNTPPVTSSPPAPSPPSAAESSIMGKKPDLAAASPAQLRKLVEKFIALNPNGVKLLIDRRMVDQRSLPLPVRGFEIQELGVGGDVAKAITDADLDLLAAERSVQILTLNDTSITRLDGLKAHRVLRILSVNGTALGDDALKALEGMSALQELGLNGTKVAGPGLASLVSCGNLHVLSLWGTQITDDSLSHLSRLKDLSRLNIGNTKVTGAGLKNLSTLTKLTYLSLDGLTLGAGAFEFVPQMKSLTTLDLSSAKLESAHLTRVALRTGLEVLSLNGASINGSLVSDADLRELSALTKLKELYLSATAVTGTGLSSLIKIRNLERLDIEGSSSLTDEGLVAAVRTFPDLVTLIIGGKITGSSMPSLSQLRKLKFLRLNGPDLNDSSVSSLPQLRGLETLEVSAPRITAAVSAALSRQSSLTRLAIGGTAVNDDAIPDLIKIKGLRELNLGNNTAISAAGVERLKKALPNCTITR